jgi:hypothetical protein
MAQVSSAMWKWIISALVLACGSLLALEVSHAVRPMLIEGRQGSIGVIVTDHLGTRHDGHGTHRLGIESVAPGSPMLAAGAKPGDALAYERYQDRWRRFAVGEAVGLTLFQAGEARHLTLVAQAQPIGFAEYFDYWARCLLAVAALLFSLLIGFKQAEVKAYRALAMSFIGLSLMFYFPFNYSPAGPIFTISKLGNTAAYVLIWYWCVVFALNYQPYQQTRVRDWLGRSLPWFRALAFAGAGYSVWFGLGHEAPSLLLVTTLPMVCGLVITIASLVDGWRNCSGEMRQRHLWMLLSFAFGAIPPLLIQVPALDWTIRGLPATVALFFVGQFLMYSGLAYAVLRYRVFNFDFAISRALVFSVVSVMLLCCFGLIQWLYSSMVEGGAAGHGGEGNSVMVDAAIALFTYLVFHMVHGTLERWVERFFFGTWHDNEHKLRKYVGHAAHVATVDILLGSLRTEMDRFTRHAGCAIYLKQADGAYTLASGTLEHAPARIDPNDGLAVALRAELVPLVYDRVQTAVPGELALPMCHRGALNGFILLGSKRNGQSYRPDESKVLGFAAHQIGLDLHALRVEALEHAVEQLALTTQQQSGQLALMAGRRKSVRQLAVGAAAPEALYAEGQV